MNDNKTEEWHDGKTEEWLKEMFLNPIFPYSNIPVFHPIFQFY